MAPIAGWGGNSSGELTLGYKSGPVFEPTPSIFPTVKQVDTGYFNASVLFDDEHVETCGQNGNGACGDGTRQEKVKPVVVPGVKAVAIASGAGHTLALGSDGTVKAWGGDVYGSIGDGFANYDEKGNKTPDAEAGIMHAKDKPVLIPGLTGVVKIYSAGGSCYAVLSDGTLKVWGEDHTGQFGMGKPQLARPVPVTSPTPGPVKRLWCMANASEGGRTFIELQNGDIYVAGANAQGQFGNGTTSKPTGQWVKLSLTNVKKIAGSVTHTLVLFNDGSLQGAGDASWGELGLGADVADKSTFTTLPLTDVSDIAGALRVSLAIVKGKVLGTGWNQHELIADGSTEDKAVFTELNNIEDALGLVANEFTAFAYKTKAEVPVITVKNGKGSITVHWEPRKPIKENFDVAIRPNVKPKADFGEKAGGKKGLPPTTHEHTYRNLKPDQLYEIRVKNHEFKTHTVTGIPLA